MGPSVSSGEEPTAAWSASDLAEALGRESEPAVRNIGHNGWTVVEPVADDEPEPVVPVVPEPEPVVPEPEPEPEPEPVVRAPAPLPQASPDAPRTEALPGTTRARSALALLFVAALAGVGLAASVAVGFGVIWLVLRRLVGG